MSHPQVKAHTLRGPERKKAYRRNIHEAAAKGFINRADGTMVNRGSVADNSMKRDYYPQSA